MMVITSSTYAGFKDLVAKFGGERDMAFRDNGDGFCLMIWALLPSGHGLSFQAGANEAVLITTVVADFPRAIGNLNFSAIP